ncbi:MAG: outer membrane protein assembly factor BamD [Gammaproteobacteria bacterium]|nr:outer membrane protein assembly factor BamD [Gammaproteobacteria bacterium]
MTNFFRTIMANRVKKTALILSFLLMIGCSAESVDPTLGLSAAEIYTKAKVSMNSQNFTRAIELYETLESRYPFGIYATQAQLDVIYAYFLFEEPESATAAADRFIKLHPRHNAVDYAYFMKGRINFGLQKSIVDNFYTRDLADYDDSIMLQSYQDFAILVNRFPDSKYSKDAIKRMVYLRNQLARSELKMAEFYLMRKAWVATANRTKHLLETYQGSTSIKRALQIQIYAYQKLELNDLVEDTRRILILNYGEEAAEFSI